MFSNRHLVYLLLFRISRSIAAGMITLAFPYLVLNKYHYGSLTLGLLYTAAAVATAVAGLLVGFLADLWGRRRSLWLIGLMLPVSSAIVLGTHHLAWLFLAVTLGGYSATGSLIGGGVGGAAQPVQTAILASLAESRERTIYFSVFSFLGGVCAAGGSLAARLFTTRDVFAAATVVALAGLVFLIPLRLPEPAGELRRMKSARVIGQFSVTGVLNGFSQGLIMPFLIPFFVLVYHLPKDRMAIYSFASGVLGALALLTAPKLDQWLGFVRAIAWTRGLGAVMIALLPLWHNLPLALAIYLLIPALRVAALPTQQRALTDMVHAEETGRALGFNQVMRLGASSGAVALTGYLFEETDFAMPFELYAAIMVANIFLYFRFFGHRDQRPIENPVELGQESGSK
ncbi:MAG TPA: MFS transporter [Terriglobales bacterium]|nr:MFS transporter [Terriglobales bacterium]